jgi:lipid-A-disaccharide synthase
MPNKKHTILIIAGEESGDIHASNLITEMLHRNPSLQFYGIGGDRLKKAGVKLMYHIKDMAFLGFFEVIQHLPFIRKVYKNLSQSLDEHHPDLVILVDYPGFNIRFAREAKKRTIPVIYYISPQIWAWNKKRINTIAQRIAKMIVLFPFEVKLYQKKGVDVSFIGHPLKDIVKPKYSRETFLNRYRLNHSHPIISLLPGSRKQEVEKLLPAMIQGVEELRKTIPQIQAIIARVGNLEKKIYSDIIKDKNIPLITNETYDIIHHSDAALVASGTATLETAILETPMVILYKITFFSYVLGKALVKLNNFGLVNIVAGKTIVPELLQHQVIGTNLAEAIYPFLTNKKKISQAKKELKRVSTLLGSPGASKRGAEIILRILK